MARLWLVALALLVVPTVLGFALGPAVRRLIAWALRRRRVSARAQTVLQCAAACAVPFLVVWENLAALRLGFWDALVAGTLFGGGLLAGMRGWRPRWETLALVGAATALAAATAEVAVRVALPHAPSFPRPETAHVTLPGRERLDVWAVGHRPNISAVCRAVFGQSWPWERTWLAYDWRLRRINFPDQWRRPPGASRVVVHVGDSMVYGEGVDGDEVFTAVLGRAEPATAHVNAGISAIGPQEYLALGRVWIAAARPDLVVTYFFVGNDIDPVLAAYPCCGMEQLYAVDAAAVEMRCPTPRPASPRAAQVRRYVGASPPPLALRLLTGHSKFARHLAGAMLRPPPGTMVVNDEEAWRRAAVVFRIMRDDAERAGARFALVVLPLRSALLVTDDHATTARSIRDRVVRMATGMGIVTLDAWDAFEDAARRTDAARWFASEREDDLHFSAAGHRLLAEWLAPRLHAVATSDAAAAPSAGSPE